MKLLIPMLNVGLFLLPGFVVVESWRNNTGEARLFNDIILDNNPYERPRYSKSDNVTVEFDFHLRSVSHFNEASQQLVCTGWFQMSWMDEFLTWDPAVYDGTESITPPSSYVWKPDVVAVNSFQQLDSLGGDFVSLVLSSSGNVEWKPGDMFSIPCEVDIQRYPFDSLVCNLQLVVWSHTESEVNLQPSQAFAGIDQFKDSGQWSLLSTSVKQNPTTSSNQSVSRVIITMTLARAPTNFVFSFILPVMILSLLGTFVFLIPSDSGEKISFAITIPLSYGVYMGFLTTMVPQTSQGVSVFVIFLGLTLVLSAIFVILSIFTVRVSARTDTSRPIPNMLQKLTLWIEAVKTSQSRRKKIGDISQIDELKESERNENMPQPVTWMRVGKALDLMLFWMFCLPIILTLLAICFFVNFN